MSLKKIYIVLVCLIVSIVASPLTQSHPEDEFCSQESLDPLLCAELAALDSDQISEKSDVVMLARTSLATGILYLRLGVEHILPAGLDHLLFVALLLLSSRNLRLLVYQISCFTLAHTVTLFLVLRGILTMSGAWVEALIAFSIVIVGLENIIFNKIHRWRLALVFAFGLLHGVGFAGALAELGIPGKHFISALLGFNLGVELGQLGFALVGFTILCWLMQKEWYRRRLVVPVSGLILWVALFWTFERLSVVWLAID